MVRQEVREAPEALTVQAPAVMLLLLRLTALMVVLVPEAEAEAAAEEMLPAALVVLAARVATVQMVN